MEVFLATLSPMLVLFIYLSIGFILNKTKIVPENSGTVMSKLENFVFVPALVISSFSKNCTVDSLKKDWQLVLYAVLGLTIAYCISLPLSSAFAKKGTYQKNIYKYALTFGNFGFMGNAVVPAILGSVFGDSVLYYYLLFTLPLQIAVNTWGIYVLIPKENRTGSPLKNLLTPAFISIIIGMIIGLTGLGNKLPSFISEVLNNCGNCMGPVAMILTGFVVGGYSVKELLGDKKVYITTFLRLFVIPAFIIGIMILINASPMVVCFTTFAFATPLGMNTVVFPAAFGGETRTGASMAMISHSLSVITIPIVYSIVSMFI